jgi:hypothetical protein
MRRRGRNSFAGFHSRTPFAVTFATFLAILAGCHSRFVEATIDNQSAATLHVVEVDYPSASFGTESIAAHSQFHYRFKLQGSGPLKLEFTGADGKVHDVEGPELREGQEGRLTITIDPTGNVSWQPALH